MWDFAKIQFWLITKKKQNKNSLNFQCRISVREDWSFVIFYKMSFTYIVLYHILGFWGDGRRTKGTGE